MTYAPSTTGRWREIDGVLKELRAAWLHDPDLRLGQLLVLALGNLSTVYDATDQEWVAALGKTWKGST